MVYDNAKLLKINQQLIKLCPVLIWVEQWNDNEETFASNRTAGISNLCDIAQDVFFETLKFFLIRIVFCININANKPAMLN
jgi:hypothetical protein